MEDKINISEVLKDCPKGMELDCSIFDGVKFDGIEAGSHPIKITVPYVGVIHLNKFGEYFMFTQYTKCVIFPKGKTTWEGFVPPYQFKDGDIVYLDFGHYYKIIIFKRQYNDFLYYHALLRDDNELSINNNYSYICTSYLKEIRYATKEEKQKLFNTINAHGYCWDDETKTLNELPKFKDGDVITCTNSACSFAAIFKEMNTDTTFRRYASFTLDDAQQLSIKESWSDFKKPRFATEEEKEKLFQAIKNNGYRWNPDNKTLEKLPKFKVGDRIILKYNPHNIPSIRIKAVTKTQYILENGEFFYIKNSTEEKYVLEDKFDITTLKPFDKVLVRGDVGQKWTHDFFGFMDKDKGYPFVCVGHYVIQCIPYEGNEHLLSKTDDCEEYFKIWEH